MVSRRILERLCGRTPYFRYWVNRTAGRSVYFNAKYERALSTTLGEHIGTRSHPKPYRHRRGLVAETLWRELSDEFSHPLGARVPLKELTGSLTAGGPDGFVVYSDSNDLHWRLWEVKHSAQRPDGAKRATDAAVLQLQQRSAGYLTMLVTAYQDDTDTRIRELCQTLFDDWDSAHRRSGIGIAAVTHARGLPDPHFADLNQSFPRLTQAGQLEGLLLGVDRYDRFVDEVCEHLWTKR